jgi:hypothetical protein
MVSIRFLNCQRPTKEVIKRVGPYDRSRIQINQELKIETDCMGAGGQIQVKKKLILKRATLKKWRHCVSEVTVLKDDLSHRVDVFCIPHTKRILISDLEVFKILDERKSSLAIGVATDAR